MAMRSYPISRWEIMSIGIVMTLFLCTLLMGSSISFASPGLSSWGMATLSMAISTRMPVRGVRLRRRCMGTARLVRIVHDLLPRLATPCTPWHRRLCNLEANSTPPRLFCQSHCSCEPGNELVVSAVVGRKHLTNPGQGRKSQGKSSRAM